MNPSKIQNELPPIFLRIFGGKRKSVNFHCYLVFIIASLQFTVTDAQIQSLPRYSCLSKQYDTEKWLHQFDRKLDSSGVVIQAGKYHPLSIAFYGIMNYEDYVLNGDTACLRKMDNQFQYFTDTTHLDFVDDQKGAGLSYNDPFLDLKPPWYSGMTQGAAISFVLRYYLARHDPQALTLAKQFAYFMLRPSDQGGTIDTTQEGFLWIEEYPNSNKSPEVLNGGINGLIGLYEYLQFFPKDQTAREIHDKAFKGLLAALPYYDTENWTLYNRSFRERKPVNNNYVRYETAQMAHLFELYHEPTFYHQMQIWAYFAHNIKDSQIKSYRHPDFQFGQKLPESGRLLPETERRLFALAWDTLRECATGKHGKMIQFPREWNSNSQAKYTLPKPTTYLQLKFDVSVTTLQLEAFAENATQESFPIEIQTDQNTIQLTSCTPFSKFELRCKNHGPKEIKLNSMVLFDGENCRAPMIVFDTVFVNQLLEEGKSYKIECATENVCDLSILYKHAVVTGKPVAMAHWKAAQWIEDPSKPFLAPESGYYMFLCAFRFTRPDASISRLKVVPLE
jgi:heparosan-N-sulfate-glucuronate 5-epimerase